MFCHIRTYTHMYNIILDTFILQNCDVTSPSIGTIRVLCDSSHQILVNLTCSNNSSNCMVTGTGNNPLTITGLNPGVMYNVTIYVFDGSQVVFNNQVVMRTITVMGNMLGKILHMYVCTYVRMYCMFILYVRTYVCM